MDSTCCPVSPIYNVSSSVRHGRVSSCDTLTSPLRFCPVTVQSMVEILPYLKLEHSRTTDFSYGGILMWVDFFKYEYCIFENTLFIKGLVEDNVSVPAFSLPLGELSLSRAIDILAGYCREHSMSLEFSAVPLSYVDTMKICGAKKVLAMPDWSDYLYDIESMASLKGKKMSKKRNHVNRFIASNPSMSVTDLDSTNANEALSFMDVYDGEADGDPMELTESALTRKMLGLVADGNTFFEGIIVRADGKIVGFSLGDTKGDTLFVHIEKATRSIPGSYETVCNEFAKRMLEKHPNLKYINREDDGGDPGLRKSKLSYHPVDILEKYNIIF